MDTEEEIYVKWLQGMYDIGKDDCIILNKCLYGLVQVTRQHFKKAIKILKNLGFVGGYIDPSLYAKKSAKGKECIALYKDDNLMEGDVKAIENAISVLKNNGLVIKVMEGLQDYFPCKIKIFNR